MYLCIYNNVTRETRSSVPDPSHGISVVVLSTYIQFPNLSPSFALERLVRSTLSSPIVMAVMAGQGQRRAEGRRRSPLQWTARSDEFFETSFWRKINLRLQSVCQTAATASVARTCNYSNRGLIGPDHQLSAMLFIPIYFEEVPRGKTDSIW